MWIFFHNYDHYSVSFIVKVDILVGFCCFLQINFFSEPKCLANVFGTKWALIVIVKSLSRVQLFVSGH